MKIKFLIFVSIVLFCFSCSNPKPEDVVLSFYDNLNANNFIKAKELATPSAQEFVDKLEKTGIEYLVKDTVAFKIMDVDKKEYPQEGDIAKVNYKLGKFKSFVELKWTEGQYKINFSDELLKLKLITINSVDIVNMLAKLGEEGFKEKFLHHRIKILNLLNPGISYIPEKSAIYVDGFETSYRDLDEVYLCDKKLETTYSPFKSGTYSGIHSNIYLNCIDDEETNKYKNSVERTHQGIIEGYKCKYYFDVEGIVNEVSFYIKYIELKNSMLNIKSCE